MLRQIAVSLSILVFSVSAHALVAVCADKKDDPSIYQVTVNEDKKGGHIELLSGPSREPNALELSCDPEFVSRPLACSSMHSRWFFNFYAYSDGRLQLSLTDFKHLWNLDEEFDCKLQR